jgi:hypothetical protein
MNPIAGLSTTGRRLHGPASDLIELVSESGYRHTAIVFHPEYRDHPAINSALSVVAGYLESPMVTGMVELFAHDTSEGAFVYPTGQATSVAELNRTFADFGEAPGVRAGLELMYAAGEILIEAAETGEGHGVYSHGGLTPWRLMIKPDGQVQIIGYALPQVEILRFHEDHQAIPREDSFRYCPPERMEAGAEDISSDLFALALIAFELMTGKPVYDGLVNDIRAMASRAEGSRRLFRFRDQLPRSVQEFLKICLRRDTEDRFSDGEAFMQALSSTLSGGDILGPSLHECMDRLGSVPQRMGTPLQDGGATMMVTRDKLAEMVEQQEEQPTRGVWKPPTRKRRATPRAAASSGDEPTPSTPPAAPPAEEPAQDLNASSDGPRWRRPSRRSAPRAEPEPVQEELPTSEPTPEPTPEPPAEPGGRRVSSLVDNIIGGGGRRPPRRRAPPRRMGSVDELQPAAAESAPPAPPVPSPPAAEPAPTPPPEISPPASSDTASVVERAAAEARPEPAPPEPPPAPEPRRAPVRLPSRTRTPPSAAPVEDEAPAVSLGPPPPALGPSMPPPVVEKAPEPPVSPPPPPELEPAPPAPAPPPALSDSPPEMATMEMPEPLPLTFGRAPAEAMTPLEREIPEAVESASPPKPAVSSSPPPLGQERRIPDPLAADGATGKPTLFRLRLSPESKERRFRLPADQPVSEAVAKLVGMLLPLRADASGRLSGWYRFAQAGLRPPGNPAMDSFDVEQPLDLEFVPNEVIARRVRVESDAGTTSLLLQLGVAVPACAIVDHVTELLGLPAGRWRLCAGDRALHSHEILADLLDAETLDLVIRR